MYVRRHAPLVWLQVGGGPQQPLHVVHLYEATGVHLQLDVKLGTAEPQLPGCHDEQLRVDGTSYLYVGDHQACSVPRNHPSPQSSVGSGWGPAVCIRAL